MESTKHVTNQLAAVQVTVFLSAECVEESVSSDAEQAHDEDCTPLASHKNYFFLKVGLLAILEHQVHFPLETLMTSFNFIQK